MNRPSAIVNFERISLASMIILSSFMILMVYEQTTFNAKMFIAMLGWLIFNLFLIFTITLGRSVVSRNVYGFMLALTVFFCFDNLINIGFMPDVSLPEKIGPYLYFNGLLSFALLYLLFDPSSTEWLKSPATDDKDSE